MSRINFCQACSNEKFGVKTRKGLQHTCGKEGAAYSQPVALPVEKERGVTEPKPYQWKVDDWMMVCFGEKIASDVTERNHRFFEEATELVQATGMTKSECQQLVDYVFGRDIGEVNQEIGGTIVTLAALCNALGLDMNQAGETELARIWTKVEKIREKQANKPKHSPLPASSTPPVQGVKERAKEYATQMMGIGEYDEKWKYADKYMWGCLYKAHIAGSSSSQSDAGKDGSEAVEFAEWVRDGRYVWSWDGKKWIAAWDKYSEHTTPELYTLFLKSKNK